MMHVMRAFKHMNSHSLTRRQIRNVVLMTLLAVCGTTSLAQKSAGSQTKSPQTKTPLAKAIERTLAEGHDAILPPHVSNMLGISPDAHEVPVKQFAAMGEPIRGFEVSTVQQNDVVVWVESRAQRQSTFYLMSKRGTLRRVVEVVEGTGHSRRPTKEDQDAFQTEKQRWVDQLTAKH